MRQHALDRRAPQQHEAEAALGGEQEGERDAADRELLPRRERGGLPLAAPRDLLTVAGRENLGQALILRLLTPLGDLAPLGHPTYGSRLTGLIGRTNDSRSRHLARLYVLEALAQESRVAKLLSIRVDPVAGQPDTLRIALSVLPRGDDQPLALALEVTL